MIAIKGYSMPKDCINCVMQFGGWCGVSPPEVDERVAETVEDAINNGKPDWCPLVEIDTEPVKHGRWIAIANGNMKNWKQKCSCCGYITRGKGKYCKECGARMDGGDDNG